MICYCHSFNRRVNVGMRGRTGIRGQDRTRSPESLSVSRVGDYVKSCHSRDTIDVHLLRLQHHPALHLLTFKSARLTLELKSSPARVDGHVRPLS